MPDSKIYLNVPFAQKDEAKALGARWDAVNKKWYVTANKDIALFARWQTEPDAVEPASKISSSASGSFTGKSAGVRTHATIEDFVAYNGDAPPWS
jgi:hypothetical protein